LDVLVARDSVKFVSEGYREKGYIGRGADSEKRAEATRKMHERSREEAAEREAARERCRLSGIEYDRRWEETYAEMEMDDVIEIPGRQDGKDIVIKVTVGPGGRLTEVETKKETP
jgi:hypothetical protein